VVRHDGQVFAIGDRCTHQGAPLHRGPVTFAGSPPVITCPVHGSRYALDTGKVLRGPATVAATAYDVRVDEGTVQIRRQG
jgi:nitrite reductase/ring-hydroxylating ferredoxin subunit